MPYADPEEKKKNQRELMRKRRAAAKAPAPEKPAPVARRKATSPPKPAPAPAISPPAPMLTMDTKGELSEFTQEQIDRAAAMIFQTRQTIARQGWILWKCNGAVNGVVVVVEDSNAKGYPSGYPVYTFKDLNEISHLSSQAIKSIHRFKVVALQVGLPGIVDVLPSERNN